MKITWKEALKVPGFSGYLIRLRVMTKLEKMAKEKNSEIIKDYTTSGIGLLYVGLAMAVYFAFSLAGGRATFFPEVSWDMSMRVFVLVGMLLGSMAIIVTIYLVAAGIYLFLAGSDRYYRKTALFRTENADLEIDL